MSITDTKSNLGNRRGGGITRCARIARTTNMTRPAVLHRNPAKTPGETVWIPTFIASHVVPQTKQMNANIKRCDSVALGFMVFRPDLPRPLARGVVTTAAGGWSAAVNRHI